METEEKVIYSEGSEVVEGSETVPSEPVDYTEQFEELLESQKTLIEMQETQTQTLEAGETVDYTSHFETLTQQLQTVIDNQTVLLEQLDIISLSSSSIITYAIFYVPLVAIIGCGWWFWKQFIR